MSCLTGRSGVRTRQLCPVAWLQLVLLALAVVIFHLAIGGNYGWFRDELYYIEAGKHLCGGYVEFPVMIALLANLERFLFGPSLTALHVLPALAGAAIIVLTGLMAREFGGGRVAQTIAGLSVAVAPAFVGADAVFTMDAFDELWWTLAAYILLRVLSEPMVPVRSRGCGVLRNPRSLWLIFGFVCGLGLLTKLTILGFGFAVALGLLVSPRQRRLRTPWPYIGGAFALAFLTPYVIWNASHDWATLTFWHNYSHGEGTATFLIQVLLLMQPLAFPLWVAGLWRLLRHNDRELHRPLAVAFLVLLALFLAVHAKSYFLVPAFPPLLAAGSVALEEKAKARPKMHLVGAAAAALVLGGIVLAPVVAPVLPAKTLASIMHSPIQPIADRFGWPQYVRTLAAVYYRLPRRRRGEATILAGNYGEAGAVDLLGPAYHLPRVISPRNTYYFWGQGVVPGPVVIATDFSRFDLARYFESVRRAATIPPEDGIQNEEAGRAVFVCRGLKMQWPEVWRRLRNFS